MVGPGRQGLRNLTVIADRNADLRVHEVGAGHNLRQRGEARRILVL